MRCLNILFGLLFLSSTANVAVGADYSTCVLEAALKVQTKKDDNVVAIASAIVNLCEPSIESDNFIVSKLAMVGNDVRAIEKSILQSQLRQEMRTIGFNAAIAVLAHSQRSN